MQSSTRPAPAFERFHSRPTGSRPRSTPEVKTRGLSADYADYADWIAATSGTGLVSTRGFAALPDVVDSTMDRIIGQIENDAFVLKARCAEIQQQSASTASHAEIVDQLRDFNRANRVQRFHFDKNLVIAD